MKRLLVTFDDDAYEDLRRLAFEKKVPMAQLVRYSLDKTFEDDLDVIAGMRAIEERMRDPASTVTLEEYLESRGIELPDHSRAKGGTRTRRAAS